MTQNYESAGMRNICKKLMLSSQIANEVKWSRSLRNTYYMENK